MRRRPLALCLPLLPGCSGSLLPKPAAAPARYTLDSAAAPQAAAAAPPGAPALLVAVPLAAAGCDSTRMVYLRHPQQLEAYAQAEWVDTPAQMLAPLLHRALQGSGLFSAVLLAPTAARAPLQLETMLTRLQQDFNTHPSVLRLGLQALLLDGATRKVIAWRAFEQAVPAPTEDAAGGAAAARQALQVVLAALQAFCAQALAALALHASGATLPPGSRPA